MSYDAVLFDMDGVLVTGYETPNDVYREAAERTIRAFGPLDRALDDLDPLVQPASAAAFREACTSCGIPADAAWAYRERAASSLAGTRFDTGDRNAHPDVEALAELADRYALGICSNNRHDTVEDCVRRFGWTEAIDAVRGRYPTLDDFDRRKPDPTYLAELIDRLEADRPLFVGDRASDVRTADRVGCDAALIARSGTFPEDCTPTFRLRSLTDLVELHRAEWEPDAASTPP